VKRRWGVLAALCVLGGLVLRRGFPAVRFCGFLLLCAGPVFLLWGFLSARRERRGFRLAWRVLVFLLTAGFALFGVLEARIVSFGRTDWERPAEAAVILGAMVDGSTPSLSLLARLEAALDYLADKPALPIVVSGGQGAGEDISEAACMAQWLTDHGVDSSRIYLEDRSRNTEENIRCSKEVLAELGLSPDAAVAVVSADYHLYRASLYWGDSGFVPVAARMPWRYLPLTVNYYIREVFGVVYLRILG